jgi:CPA2 family monovalent cation:H+ antiporter-2
VVTFAGLALLTAGIAQQLGVSEAIGAFMIGLALGATRTAGRIRRLVHPLRDAFAAVLFVAFGLSIDPADLASVAVPVAVAVALTVILNLAAGAAAARPHGLDGSAALNMGFTILARGEFALVLAALAASAGLDPRLAPFVAGYILVLAIASPLAAAHGSNLALAATRRPRPEQDIARPTGRQPGAVEDGQQPVPVRQAG